MRGEAGAVGIRNRGGGKWVPWEYAWVGGSMRVLFRGLNRRSRSKNRADWKRGYRYRLVNTVKKKVNRKTSVQVTKKSSKSGGV